MSGKIKSEPFLYPDENKDIVKEFIKLRYRLLPYNYTLAYESSMYGLPMARHMGFYETDDSDMRNINDQYYCGKDIIVAPVLNTGISIRELILPEGEWMNYFSGLKYKGDQKIMTDFSLSTIPLFIRSGSIIPMAPDMQYTGEYLKDSLILNFYYDPDVKFYSTIIYDDDGISRDFKNNSSFYIIDISIKNQEDTTEVILRQTGKGYESAPHSRKIFMSFQGEIENKKSVEINDLVIPVFNDYDEFLYSMPAVYYSQQDKKLIVHFNWKGDSTRLLIYKNSETGINDIDNIKSNIINVYPNPAADILKLEYNSDKSSALLEIYDNCSVLLFRKELFCIVGRNTFICDCRNINGNNISSGIYLLKLQIGQKSISRKFIVFR